MKNLSSNKTAGVPPRQVPGIGSLFRHTQVSSKKSELVILLRPVVVGDGTGKRPCSNLLTALNKLAAGSLKSGAAVLLPARPSKVNQ
ncbi:MAG: hypothetical protein R2864_06635 [Syntrophotaleaceae bacterium]